MNVFYNKATTGLKNAPCNEGESDTVYLSQGTVYTIDSEGTLLSTPRYLDGSYDNDNWVEVDYEEVVDNHGTVWGMLLTAIQDCLECDAMNSGWYYKAA